MNKKNFFEGITPDTLESAYQVFDALYQSDEYQQMASEYQHLRGSNRYVQKLFDELDKRTSGDHKELIITIQDAVAVMNTEIENAAMIYGIYIATKLGNIISRPAEFLEFLSSRYTPTEELYPIPEPDTQRVS